MTKAEGLHALRAYAEWRRRNPAASPRYDREPPAYLESIRHGLNAVRAIRDAARHAASAEARPGSLASVMYRQIAKDQSRLAFRAALDAVGIQGAL